MNTIENTNQSPSIDHPVIWLKSYSIGILIYCLFIMISSGDIAWGIPIAIFGGWVALQITIIPAIIFAAILTSTKITEWIEKHKAHFILVALTIIAIALSIFKLKMITVYANGFFAFKWEKFFDDFIGMMALSMNPFVVYTLLIKRSISLKSADKTQ